MIVLDTSVLSLAFRRTRSAVPVHPSVSLLRQLIEDDAPLAVPGIVLQELLSGVRAPEQATRLREALAGFPLLLADEAAHLEAAEVANACRAAGIAVSAPDCLIAAQSLPQGRSLLTADDDFARMAPHCGLVLRAW